MYNDEVMRTPRGQQELWAVLREQFEFDKQVLSDTPLESKQEAIAAKPASRVALSKIRYRNVSRPIDNRDHFLKLGRELLPFIEGAIDKRKLTTEFVQKWGMAMFCHGYIASHMLDDADDLSQVRAGLQRGKEISKHSQQKWIAHQIVALMTTKVMGKKVTRERAEEIVVDRVRDIIRKEHFNGRFDRNWYKSILGANGLASTHSAGKLYGSRMKALAAEGTHDIPSLDF